MDPHASIQIGASFIIITTNLLPCTADMSRDILYGLWAGRSYSTQASGSSKEVRLPRMDARRESLLPAVAGRGHLAATKIARCGPARRDLRAPCPGVCE
jgi:hypothetical protein